MFNCGRCIVVCDSQIWAKYMYENRVYLHVKVYLWDEWIYKHLVILYYINSYWYYNVWVVAIGKLAPLVQFQTLQEYFVREIIKKQIYACPSKMMPLLHSDFLT